MKKFLLSIGLVTTLALSSFGDTISVTTGAAQASGTNLLYSGPMRLLSITVTAGTNVSSMRFFDSPYITNTITVPAFTNITRTMGVTSNVYTSPFGVTYTNFYPSISVTTNTATGGQQLREVIYSSAFVSNTVTTITFAAGKYLQGGLLVTNHPIATVTPMTFNVEFEKIEP